MKRNFLLSCALLTALICGAGSASAQDPKLPKKVNNVKIQDLNKETVSIPHFGEKNLIIFYMDPDKHNQNDWFTKEFEAQERGKGDNLFSFGIINGADSGWPLAWIRSGARNRTKNNGGTALLDADRTLQKEWGLGDCNDKFVLLVVSKEGELVYCKKGELSRKDVDDFYKFIEDYK